MTFKVAEGAFSQFLATQFPGTDVHLTVGGRTVGFFAWNNGEDQHDRYSQKDLERIFEEETDQVIRTFIAVDTSASKILASLRR